MNEYDLMNLAKILGGKKTATGWKVKCPAHNDAIPSLDLRLDAGKLLWKCWAGCTQNEVLNYLKPLLPKGPRNGK